MNGLASTGSAVALGVDAYKAGWVAVTIGDRGFETAFAASRLEAIVAQFPDVVAIGVDIPIGLPERGRRRCDLAAAAMLGPRRSSVFLTPPRAALLAPTHAAASAICVQLTGNGLSQQAYALRTKILEVEQVAPGDPRIFEVHPEVSFRAMADRHLLSAKGTWAGMWDRLDLLNRQGIVLPRSLGAADAVSPIDLIDAAAAAWSARRQTGGQAMPVSEPEIDSVGRLVSIWY